MPHHNGHRIDTISPEMWHVAGTRTISGGGRSPVLHSPADRCWLSARLATAAALIPCFVIASRRRTGAPHYGNKKDEQ